MHAFDDLGDDEQKVGDLLFGEGLANASSLKKTMTTKEEFYTRRGPNGHGDL